MPTDAVKTMFENKSPLVLVAALILSVGTWMSQFPEGISFVDIFQVNHLGTLLFTVGSVLMAWFGGVPLNKRP